MERTTFTKGLEDYLRKEGRTSREFAMGLVITYKEINNQGAIVDTALQKIFEIAGSDTENVQRFLSDSLNIPPRLRDETLSPWNLAELSEQEFKNIRRFATSLKNKDLLPEPNSYPSCSSPDLRLYVTKVIEVFDTTEAAEALYDLCFSAATTQVNLLILSSCYGFRDFPQVLSKLQVEFAEERIGELKRQDETVSGGNVRSRFTVMVDKVLQNATETEDEKERYLQAEGVIKERISKEVTPEELSDFLARKIYPASSQYVVKRAFVAAAKYQFSARGSINIDELPNLSFTLLTSEAGLPLEEELYRKVWLKNFEFFKGYSVEAKKLKFNTTQLNLDSRSTKSAIEAIESNESIRVLEDDSRITAPRYLRVRQYTEEDIAWLQNLSSKEASSEQAITLAVLMRKLDLLSRPNPIVAREQLRILLWRALSEGTKINGLAFDCFSIIKKMRQDHGHEHGDEHPFELVYAFDPEKFKTYNPSDNLVAIYRSFQEAGLNSVLWQTFLPTDEVWPWPKQLDQLGGKDKLEKETAKVVSILNQVTPFKFPVNIEITPFSDLLKDSNILDIYLKWWNFIYESFDDNSMITPFASADEVKADIEYRKSGRYPITLPTTQAFGMTKEMYATYAAEIAILPILYGTNFFIIQDEPLVSDSKLKLLPKFFPEQFDQFPMIYAIGKQRQKGGMLTTGFAR